jgi:hypothetical protein
MLGKLKLGLLATVSAIAACTSSANAAGDKSHRVPYGNHGWWRVSYDPDTNTCGMRADFDNGISMAVGFGRVYANGRDHDVVLVFGSRQWTNVNGQSYQGSMQFNDGAWGYQGKLTGGITDDGTTQYLETPPLKFEVVKSFMQANNVTLFANGSTMGKYSLEGSMGGAGLMAQCQIEADGYQPRTSQPRVQPPPVPQPPQAAPAPRNPPPGYQSSGTGGGTYQM